MIGFLIALLSGALMSVQGVFNTQVTKTTGMWVSNGWVQLSAFLVCAVAGLIAGRMRSVRSQKSNPNICCLEVLSVRGLRGRLLRAWISWDLQKRRF